MLAFVVSFGVWAVVHSITAAQFFKDRMSHLMGKKLFQQTYRFFYTSFSIVSFLPVIYFYIVLPLMTIWRVAAPWSWLLLGLQAVGGIGAVVSVIQTDALSFVGLRQLLGRGETQATAGLGETLYISGLYRWMRHPLYTFSMLFLWASPVMSRSLLIFNVLATAYFVIGSIFEERRLTADFGSAYTDYQSQVPRFIPYRRPR